MMSHKRRISLLKEAEYIIQRSLNSHKQQADQQLKEIHQIMMEDSSPDPNPQSPPRVISDTLPSISPARRRPKRELSSEQETPLELHTPQSYKKAIRIPSRHQRALSQRKISLSKTQSQFSIKNIPVEERKSQIQSRLRQRAIDFHGTQLIKKAEEVENDLTQYQHYIDQQTSRIQLKIQDQEKELFKLQVQQRQLKESMSHKKLVSLSDKFLINKGSKAIQEKAKTYLGQSHNLQKKLNRLIQSSFTRKIPYSPGSSPSMSRQASQDKGKPQSPQRVTLKLSKMLDEEEIKKKTEFFPHKRALARPINSSRYDEELLQKYLKQQQESEKQTKQLQQIDDVSDREYSPQIVTAKKDKVDKVEALPMPKTPSDYQKITSSKDLFDQVIDTLREKRAGKNKLKVCVLGQSQGSGLSSTLQNHTLKNKFEYEYQQDAFNKRNIASMTSDFIQVINMNQQQKSQREIDQALQKKDTVLESGVENDPLKFQNGSAFFEVEIDSNGYINIQTSAQTCAKDYLDIADSLECGQTVEKHQNKMI